MKDTLIYLLKLFLFLLFLFITERLVFLLFQFSALRSFSIADIVLVFVHGFVMDISACAYVLLPVFILLSVHLFIHRRGLVRALQFYVCGMIILSVIINFSDIALFQSWGTRINQKAVSYLAYPKEAMGNAWSYRYIFTFLVSILHCFLFIWLYRKIFKNEIIITGSWVGKLSFIVLLPGLLVIAIRGGLQTFPTDRASAYFSKHAVLNQAALNGSWNFMKALTDPAELHINPYHYFPGEIAKNVVDELHRSPGDSSIRVLYTMRPNILLIILESFSAEVIEPLNGVPGVTPEITRLAKEGLLFTNFYAPGFRTEQGIAALISGFPSQPTTSIIRHFGKFDRLPSLVASLDSAGYASSYYYGGSLHFAYTESYLRAMGFDKLIGENDFEYGRRTGWGAYDEDLFSFFSKDMTSPVQPFFSVLMTTTNHEPFDADVEKIVPSKAGDWCSDYINTVHYTDKCLGRLIAELKTKPWYSNTLVAIVADHAHACPSKLEYNSAVRHHIPLLLLGGALQDEFRGKIVDRLSSQVDFPATILSMLHLKHNHFHWSRDVFNPSSPGFVFYSFDDGFGWIDEKQQLVYDEKLKRVIDQKNNSLSESENEKALKAGKSYLQILMDEYIWLNQH